MVSHTLKMEGTLVFKTNSGFYFPEPRPWDGWEAEALRLRLGMNQADFAERVLGCSETTLRKIERAGRAFHFQNKLQRESMDAWMAAVAKAEEIGPHLDKRWGVRVVLGGKPVVAIQPD